MILILQEVTDWYRLPGDSSRDLFSKVKWPFKSLSDLQLEDQKVTLNHLLFLLFLWSFRVAKVGTQNTKAVFEDYLWKYHVIFLENHQKNMLCWAADQKTSTILSSSHLRKKTKTPSGDFSAVTKNWDGGETWDPNLRVIVSVTSKHREESSLGERLESIITESSCWILTLNNPQNFTVANQPGSLRLSLNPRRSQQKHQHTTNQPDRPNDPTDPTGNGPRFGCMETF